MAAPNEKLAESLDVLKALQEGGHRVFRSDDFSRVHRERLVENGFLQDVMKGWLISSSPGARQGDSSLWYASFWEFCARYCRERFGDEWYLSPEQSLWLQGQRTVIPDQVVVNSPKGTNNKIELPFGTSLYDLRRRSWVWARPSSLVIQSSRRWCWRACPTRRTFCGSFSTAATRRKQDISQARSGA
jgi:hypothetical protein